MLLIVLLMELAGLRCSENILEEHAEDKHKRQWLKDDLEFQCHSLQEARAW